MARALRRERRAGSWPTTPSRPRRLAARGRRGETLDPEMWAEIGHHLTAPASDGEAREEARRAAQGVLWILRRGRAWSDLPASVAPAGLARRYWETWMADGRWLDFWGAFVARLGGDEWLGWSRALVRAGEEIAHAPGRGREAAARYAWWVVSARLLLWEARWVPAGSRPRRAG